MPDPLPQAGSPTVLEPRGGDDDQDMDEYAGFPDMNPDDPKDDDEAAADRHPVPDSDDSSDESDVELGPPQADDGRQPLSAGAVRPREDVDSDVGSVREPGYSPKKARLSALDDSIRTTAGRGKAELQSLFRTSTVRRILDDLSKQKKFQMPKNRTNRELLLADEWKTECGEVYSPPRITKLIGEMGMRPAWALDLTVVDPDDGEPWDFSVPNKRAKAVKLLDRDKPLMLVACPMCGPFSAINNFNYAKMEPKEIKAKLEKAMEHVKFSLDLCLQQYKAGRLFVFEHPTSATSWSTDMLQQMASLEGVYMAKFDFCQLGMTTKDDTGREVPAKKRTTVVTNSPNLAEVLRRAQCQKLHRHQHLIGGKASAC